jgi:hypothetical protein
MVFLPSATELASPINSFPPDRKRQIYAGCSCFSLVTAVTAARNPSRSHFGCVLYQFLATKSLFKSPISDKVNKTNSHSTPLSFLIAGVNIQMPFADEVYLTSAASIKARQG